MKKALILPLTFILLKISFSQYSFPSLDSINSRNLLKTVEYLSSKELYGRLSGSVGYYKAADFFAKEFLSLGLKQISNKSYFQKFLIEYNEIKKAEFYLITNNVKKEYKLAKDFICRGFTGSGKIIADVVFCGYGISEPALGYDDYCNVDVNGKVVLVFKQQPDWLLDPNFKWNPSLRNKAYTAFNKGAVAILFVPKPNAPEKQKPIGSVMDGEGIQLNNFPMLQIDYSVADELMEANREKTLSDLQSEIDKYRKPLSKNLNSKVEINVDAEYSYHRTTMNVIGMLEGTDEDLKDEYIIICAHLDHVGGQAGKIYFPGANDNASGSAAVLELARIFANSEEKIKRSILFVLFSNEETGLQGARYFVDNPVVPLKNIVAVLNMDCIASGDSIRVGNGLSSPELWRIAKTLDSLYTKSMVEDTWSGGGADLTPFFEKGINGLYFVTTNGYQHLHLTTDKPETLNSSLYEKVVKLVYLIASYIANN
ncbi:MAG: M20/M25/M40 family metallo-hydrolase [Ignavibacteria bacterium]|nr:M20/M25/M40 family metallo-hydrolase [Ignavibacteria bacterium]